MCRVHCVLDFVEDDLLIIMIIRDKCFGAAIKTPFGMLASQCWAQGPGSIPCSSFLLRVPWEAVVTTHVFESLPCTWETD